LLYLIKERCVVAEHLRTDAVDDGDLIRITAGGVVHLQLMANPDYLAACAEDTWVSDEAFAARIADRLRQPLKSQFSPVNTARITRELVEYLKAAAAEKVANPDVYLNDETIVELAILREAEAAISAAEVEVSRRLFVGNLPWDASAEDVETVLKTAGFSSKRVTVPVERETGHNRGYAFVDFDTSRMAMLALEAEGTLTLRGRRLRLGEAHVHDEQREAVRDRPTPRLTERLYVSNLPYSMDKPALGQTFAAHDLQVTDIYLVRDRTSGRSRGYAFVSMASLDEASRALGALDGTVIEGRKISVRPADPRQDRS
jgi:RNA recognition motif-containing protein